jgi:hypothetical protein
MTISRRGFLSSTAVAGIAAGKGAAGEKQTLPKKPWGVLVNETDERFVRAGSAAARAWRGRVGSLSSLNRSGKGNYTLE